MYSVATLKICLILSFDKKIEITNTSNYFFETKDSNWDIKNTLQPSPNFFAANGKNLTSEMPFTYL